VKYLTLLAVLLMSVALAGSGYALKERFQQGKQTRVAICQSENAVRKVIYDEHTQRVRNLRAYLRKHPNGAPAIGVTRRDVLDSITEERRIISSVAPRTCE